MSSSAKPKNHFPLLLKPFQNLTLLLPVMTKLNVSNPKMWAVIGVGFAGILILAEVNRRRLKARNSIKQDYGAFIERLELLPFPQPPPPAARLPLFGLSFAIKDKLVALLCSKLKRVLLLILLEFWFWKKNKIFRLIPFLLSCCAFLDVEFILLSFSLLALV